MSTVPKRVLFVCMGNICRSPAGEAVLNHMAAQAGMSIEVDSAGTHGYHIGEPADARMRSAGRARGYALETPSRQVQKSDLSDDRFDLVLAMDRENLQGLRRLVPKLGEHVRLFSDFTGDDWPTDVPDPYYGGDEGFEYVLDMIEAGCPKILKHLGG